MNYSYAPRLSTWLSRRDWKERIIVFNASWFVVPMGTGVITQNLVNVPYTSYWLNNLAYCFWILEIVLFVFFIVLGLIRCWQYPRLSRQSFQDFSQTSYIGAIPINLFTICVGILTFYNQYPAAVLASWVLWWIGIAVALWVGCAVLYVTYALQSPHQLKDVTGVWLLSFIPFVVGAATGSAFLPYMNPRNQQITLVVSFILWSIGLSMCSAILVIYFWRLISQSLPPREAIVSAYITMGPLGMGSFGIQNLAVGLSDYIQKQGFTLSRSMPPQVNITVISAVSEMVNWVGLLIGLFLTSWASFWFVEATISVVLNVPKRFNIGFWAFVFPVGVYANGLCRLALDLDNQGLRGWAWTCVVLTILLWIGCTLGTVYKGVWRGELFFAPGLEGLHAKQALEWIEERHEERYAEPDSTNGAQSESRRIPRADGTFTVSARPSIHSIK